jgi:SAM-dependent methyltransferase
MQPEAYDELHALEPTHWWYRGMRDITERLLTASLPRQEGLKILDAGCGAGGNLTALARFGKVSGLDYSPLALNYASLDHAGKVARATVEALPYADSHFDLVYSFDVICVREVGDDVNALREFARVTRKGGHVLVRVPALKALRGPHDSVVHGTRRYTVSELRAKMARAGLKPVRATYANSLLMPLIFVIRMIQNLNVSMGGEAASDVNQTSEPANTILTRLLGLEAQWIGAGRSFPAGVSVIVLAEKA